MLKKVLFAGVLTVASLVSFQFATVAAGSSQPAQAEATAAAEMGGCEEKCEFGGMCCPGST